MVATRGGTHNGVVRFAVPAFTAVRNAVDAMSPQISAHWRRCTDFMARREQKIETLEHQMFVRKEQKGADVGTVRIGEHFERTISDEFEARPRISMTHNVQTL